MADCASLLDEELSSFVFSYLSESSGSQYGEEEVCSDFPDFDLSQLESSDFDSVNCLSELHWCSERSSASIQCSAGDPELFEDENAALLAALTDSLDGIVEDAVGGLFVFPSLGGDPDEGEEEEEDDLPLDSEALTASLSPETEDPSLLKKLLLSPSNVPVSLEIHKDSSSHSRSSSLHVTLARPALKKRSRHKRRLRPARPTGRVCTELHRHLTTAQEAEDTPSADEDDNEEDSDSEEESSNSEFKSVACVGPPKPQFSSEKELHSVVELIKYMHTYCVPTCREHDASTRKTRSENVHFPRSLPQNRHKPTPQTCSASATRPRAPFARRREIKAHSLLKELLEAVSSFDVSKPYRMHSPPYSHCRTAAAQPSSEVCSPPARQPKDCESSRKAAKRPKSPDPEEASFSVRRSRRLASFPSRFARKVHVSCGRSEFSTGQSSEEDTIKHPSVEAASDSNSLKTSETQNSCCSHEKHACLCLPLAPRTNGDMQFCEQSLCVELCGTAGLTPPTTPPHKPVEDELFKPDGKTELNPSSSCSARPHIRKLPEQTELYAQLCHTGQTGDADRKIATQRAYGDHDYCLLGLEERRKKTAAALGSVASHQDMQENEKTDENNERTKGQDEMPLNNTPEREEEPQENSLVVLPTPTPELDAQFPVSCSPPSPNCKLPFSESPEMCHETSSGEENDVNKCHTLCIHDLPSSVTQSTLQKRIEAFSLPEDCKALVKNEERCGVITLRPAQNGQTQPHRWDFNRCGGSSRRLGRMRYIDLDEAGPGPVKSKYDALDFDTLLKEAQRSLHR